MLERVASFGERGGDGARCALLRLGIAERLGDPLRPWWSQGEVRSVQEALVAATQSERRSGEDPYLLRRRLLGELVLPILLSGSQPLKGPAAATYWIAGMEGSVSFLTDADILPQSVLVGVLPLIVERVPDPAGLGRRLERWLEMCESQSPSFTEARSTVDEGPLVRLARDETLPDDRRMAAMDCLCTILELPRVETETVHWRPSRRGDSNSRRDAEGRSMTRVAERILDMAVLEPVLDAIDEGRMAPRAERLWIEAGALVKARRVAEENGLEWMPHGAVAWFESRLGLSMPFQSSSLDEWWGGIEDRGALESLSEALGVDADSLHDPAAGTLVLDSLLEDSDKDRTRLYHELLMATAAAEQGLPRWLWTATPTQRPTGHKGRWRRALGGEVAVQDWRVELALLRSPKGLGPSEVLWSESGIMGGDTATFTSGSLDAGMTHPRRNGSGWIFRPRQFAEKDLNGGSVTAEALHPGTLGIWAKLEEAYQNGGTGLRATPNLVERVRGSYVLRDLWVSARRERLLVGPDEVRVLGTWISSDDTLVQDRFTLLVRTSTVGPPQELTDGKEWSLALLRSLAAGLQTPPAREHPRASPPKPERAPTVSPIDIEVAARWMVDFGGDLDDAAGEVADALERLEPASMVARKFDFHSVSCGFRALFSPGDFEAAELGNWYMGGSHPVPLSNPERALLSSHAELRALGMDSLGRRTEGLTHDEASAVRQSMKANGEDVSLLPPQYQQAGVFLRANPYWIEVGKLWLPMSFMLLLLAAARRPGSHLWLAYALGVAWGLTTVIACGTELASWIDAFVVAMGLRWLTVARGEDASPFSERSSPPTWRLAG